MAIIVIPSAREWTKNTGRSADDREALISFVARQSLHEQVRNGYYIISDHFIELYRKQI